MNDQVTSLSRSAGYGVSQEQRHKVLRNTYWLLALSMIPTVLGAWVGVATGITAALHGGVGLIVFLGGAFAFMYAIEKTKRSAAGVPVLLAFTFFMGLMLSRMIGVMLGFKNGTDLIMTAFAGTAGVFVVMASLASVIKRDLSGLGQWLMVGALALLVGSVINVFVGSSVGMMVISVLAIGIFSAFMLYDLKRVLDGGETNYISATLALYLDIFNVFQSLLALLGIMGGERD
ncbi:Bax inhibitor-1 family protein [Verminephrobacter eiseniae]|uniref:Modulator of FtsH protease n=1 Tax=Verminephrobacter eiseniae (strain EF01-2) TaxID=391735 RepID=A1WME5_VEREI|nr:Bax inhibitor-1 family protein [Verminephrobacter eiseniae]KAB7619067.1 BAX inhibitor (BI)-1/YccA family protein [Verminephrobacter sp. Larva24]ABM58802.1 protein of unknown function UPF0005 [Verminephrobacter eiseniae EF01-2]MCW5230871.1 BAX inhibitor (BI)-1/YccA family protein [Verminephrobacter eiseniae]MCW5259219.1 BAX inhibitor (BI)-1/YccA family protein [Verminephrobacter eiseniae]MCW5284371.1 BAX inhibitor (BI)-1/YccA family protein [Verminephrobacter eiseniae]